jgi:hypothetical protein
MLKEVIAGVAAKFWFVVLALIVGDSEVGLYV